MSAIAQLKKEMESRARHALDIAVSYDAKTTHGGGLYFLFRKGRPIYVGTATSFRRRFYQHRRNNVQFDEVRVNQTARIATEYYCIRTLNLPLNKPGMWRKMLNPSVKK